MPQPTPEATGLIILIFTVLVGSIIGAWVGVIIRLALKQPVLPRAEPVIVPWGGKSVLVVLVAWFAIMLSVPTVYRITQGNPEAAMKPKSERPAFSPGELMSLSALQNAATIVLVPLILAGISGARPRDFGLKLAGLGKQALRGLVAYPLIAPLVFSVMGICILIFRRDAHPLETAIQLDRSGKMAAILILAGVVLAPIAEELIFRGILLGWLTKRALGYPGPKPSPESSLGELLPATELWMGPSAAVELPETQTEFDDHPGSTTPIDRFDPYLPPVTPIEPPWTHDSATPLDLGAKGRFLPLALANIAVSIIFGSLHAAVWPTPIPIFFLSLGLGFLYQRTGSIVAPIVLHMTFNGVSTLVMFIALGASQQAPDKPKPVIPIRPRRLCGNASKWDRSPRYPSRKIGDYHDSSIDDLYAIRYHCTPLDDEHKQVFRSTPRESSLRLNQNSRFPSLAWPIFRGTRRVLRRSERIRSWLVSGET